MVAPVDRFSDAAAHLFRRSSNAALPGPNAPIALDEGPFVTHGLGPSGMHVSYYNFDVQPARPAPLYAFFKADGTEVAGQLHVIDVVPGDAGYSDFWNVMRVTVPDDYIANSVTRAEQIAERGLPVEPTAMLVNCPVVPDGSTAKLQSGASGPSPLQRGWYRGAVVKYFTFAERALTVREDGTVPISDIYVTFNVNPDPKDPTSGPPSGFVMEPHSLQVHNVVETVPEDLAYSPLWDVNVYDHAAFPDVRDLKTAAAAPLLVPSAALVNCPIVSNGG
jgi:hypothetical protein